jgi:hypothetical protein
MARSLAFWVAAMPLVVQVGLFLWTADRGLDLTDEGFYLLNYLHWRQMIASVSLFGAYFELPFRLLGEQVSLMRVFGLALLASCSAWLACRVLQFGRSSPIDRTWLVGLAGCAGGLCYYGYLTTLRSPSYNLLVLICIMASTALLLMLCDPHIGRRRGWRCCFCVWNGPGCLHCEQDHQRIRALGLPCHVRHSLRGTPARQSMVPGWLGRFFF